MSRLIPGRPPMSEDEFARRFQADLAANPLAAALGRASAGGDDSAYLPPALKAAGGQYGRPLAPIQPAADAAVKAFGGSGGTFGPAYTPPGPEAAARTAMAASPHLALAGGAMTGGRVVEGTRQRMSAADADDFLSRLAATRNPAPTAAAPGGPPPPAAGVLSKVDAPRAPAGPTIVGQPAGFDPTQVAPRSLWEIMNTRPENGGLSPAEQLQKTTGVAYGQSPLHFDPKVIDQITALQRQDENQSLAKQRLANDARRDELQFSPDRVRTDQQDRFLGSLLAAGKTPAETAQLFQQYNALRKTLMPADPTAVPSRGPTPAQSPPTNVGGLPAAGGNPYAIPEGDLAAANRLIGETRAVLDQRAKEKDPRLTRTDAEAFLDAIAARNLNPNAQAAYLESLFSDVVKNAPQFQDALLKSAAKAATNANLGYEFRPDAFSPPQLPGLTLRPAENQGLNFWRTMLAGGNDAGAYRTAEFGGRSVPLDVGDVSTSLFGSDADRQKATGRLTAAKLLLEAMQKRGMAAQSPQPPR